METLAMLLGWFDYAVLCAGGGVPLRYICEPFWVLVLVLCAVIAVLGFVAPAVGYYRHRKKWEVALAEERKRKRQVVNHEEIAALTKPWDGDPDAAVRWREEKDRAIIGG